MMGLECILIFACLSLSLLVFLRTLRRAIFLFLTETMLLKSEPVWWKFMRWGVSAGNCVWGRFQAKYIRARIAQARVCQKAIAVDAFRFQLLWVEWKRCSKIWRFSLSYKILLLLSPLFGGSTLWYFETPFSGNYPLSVFESPGKSPRPPRPPRPRPLPLPLPRLPRPPRLRKPGKLILFGLILNSLSLNFLPCNSSMALSAASVVSNSMYAKPFDKPEYLSKSMVTLSTVPTALKNSSNCPGVERYSTFPT